jgi:hypothetical protein
VNKAILVWVAALSFFCWGMVAGAAEPPRADWRSRQTIWWKDDQLVKAALLSLISLETSDPRLISDPNFVEHSSSVANLLLIFDSESSQASLSSLASLAPYYLGEAPSEIYSCLVLRKGQRIKKMLSRLKASPRNECIDKFGPPKASTSGLEAAACLSDAAYRSRLNSFFESIERNQSCTIDQ